MQVTQATEQNGNSKAHQLLGFLNANESYHKSIMETSASTQVAAASTTYLRRNSNFILHNQTKDVTR